MQQATGAMSNLVVMLSIMAILLAIGIGALFAALYAKRRWRVGYGLEIFFVSLLFALGIYADIRSTSIYTAYEASLPQEGLQSRDWKAELTGLEDKGFDRIVRVYAYQWGFTFINEQGAASRNAVKVEPGQKVLFAIMSNDVIHGFNVPVARVISEFEPPNVRTLWIRAPDEPGKYLIQCTNYCGLGHAQMKAWLVVGDPGGETANAHG